MHNKPLHMGVRVDQFPLGRQVIVWFSMT